MRKHFFILIFILISFVSFSQTNNLPPSTGNFTIFKNNPVTFTFNFPDGYAIPGSVVGETWDTALPTSQKISVTPSTNVVGQSVTITYSSAQLKSLGGISKFLFYLVFNGNNPVTKKYILGGQITLSAALGTNNSNSTQITIPDIGDIKINLLGETSLTAIYSQNASKAKDSANIAKTLAQTAQSAAQTQASLAINASSVAQAAAYGRTPFGTMAKLRAIPDTSYRAFYVTDAKKEGMFIYNPTSTLPDDSAMVIVSGGRKFERQYEFMRPEYFGAIPGDNIDDYIPLQKMLNWAINTKGLHIMLSRGAYKTSHALRLRNIGEEGGALFNLTIEGAGQFISSIEGMAGIQNQYLMYLDEGSGLSRSNHILIKQFAFSANGAKMCFFASQAIEIKFENMLFYGGEDVCMKIGTYGTNESYSNYIISSYFNGHRVNGGLNNGCLQLHGCRMTVVDQMESDGGRFSIDIAGSDKSIITNSKLEGAKRAAIKIDGYGAEHKITGNTLNPYTGVDSNAQYDGTLNGIEVIGGLNSNCIISNNLILVPNFELPNNSWNITKLSGSIEAQAAYVCTQATTGATGRLVQYNQTENRIVLEVISGVFDTTHVVTQASTNATLKLNSQPINRHCGILMGSGAYSIISNNIIRLNPQYGILSYAEGMMINNNMIESNNYGIYTSNSAVITANQVGTPGGSAIEQLTGTQGVILSSNRIMSGSVVNFPGPFFDATGVSTFNTYMQTNLPYFSNNSEAEASNLPVGSMYRTYTGEVRVRY